MNLCCCPICQLPFPTHELERHANSHFEDDELARDTELARQIALAPLTPPHHDNDLYVDVPFGLICGGTSEASTSQSPENNYFDKAKHIDEKICHIISLQCKASLYEVQRGLITLLKNCLESETGNSTSLLSGYVDHFQSIRSEDAGWGCGWRNIQMACSHLLMKRPEAREVLFGGCGFVPDIASLQRWLEVAWERGFDIVGSFHFNGKVSGSKKWIGATEYAALFSSFGLRARIVDFGGTSSQKNTGLIYGPMDKFVSRKKVDNVDNTHKLSGFSSMKDKGYQVLIDWVWSYFSDGRLTDSCKHGVVVTEKMPLYFQHDGHSRTIVGVQVNHQRDGRKQCNLLILDPGDSTEALEGSLASKFGWQKLIKRGVHTLKKPQYQLCYVDPGLACDEEMERLKNFNGAWSGF
ncbi:hypothetical protein Ancab_008918 [Ancistrocladus abbreviatus]